MHHNNNLIFENLEVYDDLVFSMTILTDIGDPTLDIEKPSSHNMSDLRNISGVDHPQAQNEQTHNVDSIAWTGPSPLRIIITNTNGDASRAVLQCQILPSQSVSGPCTRLATLDTLVEGIFYMPMSYSNEPRSKDSRSRL